MPLALITGASTGIGRATALRLAANGWTVLAGVRDPAAGEQLVADAGTSASHAAGTPGSVGSVIALTLDVTDAAQMAAHASASIRRPRAAERPRAAASTRSSTTPASAVGGPLELIAAEDCAGSSTSTCSARWRSRRRCCRRCVAPRGRIVFVSSIGGRVAMAFMAPYAASKHAIEAIGDALRVELRSSHVKVALVEPGSVATPIWDKGRAMPSAWSFPPELQDAYGRVPAAMGKALEDTARRGVPPEQVAETIERALTASRPKARYLVGRDARAMLIGRRLLPDHVFDRVVKRALGV